MRKRRVSHAAPRDVNPLQIKPIQTRWRARHYRSRLEARWAVFFDTMRIQFQYEPESFRLEDGSIYLPDFYLPDVQWYAEVKPHVGECGKAYPFVKTTGLSILRLDGEPGFRSYTGFGLLDGEGTEPVGLEYSLDVIGYDIVDEHRLWSDPDYEHLFTNVSQPEDVFSLTYRAAVEAALSARFGS